jgi:hypothetical protein
MNSSSEIIELKSKIIIFIFSANLNAIYELGRNRNPNYNEQLHNLLSSTMYEEYKEAISNVLINSKKKYVVNNVTLKPRSTNKIYLKSRFANKIYLKPRSTNKIYLKSRFANKIYLKPRFANKLYLKPRFVNKIYLKPRFANKLYLKPRY